MLVSSLAAQITTSSTNRRPPSPTFPRKFADVDWGSRKINPNKICAECWPGAAFGPYWLLTERLRYETTPLLPALRDRVRVHGRRDDAYGSHCGGDSASRNRRVASESRRHEQRHRQGRRRHRHKCDSRFRRGRHRNIYRRQPDQPRGRQHHRHRHARHRRRNRNPCPIPPRPNQRHARRDLRHVTNHLRPLRHRKPKRRHLHSLVERRPRGHRDDLPRNPNQRLVAGQGAHGRAHLLGRRQPGKRLRPVAPGMGQLLQPLGPRSRSGPKNPRGTTIHLHGASEGAYPKSEMVKPAAARCRGARPAEWPRPS